MASVQTPHRPHDARLAALQGSTPALMFAHDEYNSSSPPLRTPARHANDFAAPEPSKRGLGIETKHAFNHPLSLPIYHQAMDGTFNTTMSIESAQQVRATAAAMARSITAPAASNREGSDATAALKRATTPQPSGLDASTGGKRRKTQHERP